jgi:hypothetical protein
VYYSSSTTVATNVYTGQIIMIEALDTTGATAFATNTAGNNNRTGPAVRIRICEVYDDAATGTPANKVKYAAQGISAASVSQTPNANNARSDSFGPIFTVTDTITSTTPSVGWVHLQLSESGFGYWIGADATRLLASVNSNGGMMALCGKVETLLATGDTVSVYLAGNSVSTAATTQACSWLIGTGTWGGVRWSREPLITASTTGAFVGHIYGHLSQVDVTATNAVLGKIGTTHKYHTTQVAHPAFLHGIASTTSIGASLRSYRAKLNGFVVGWGNANATIGDTLTIGGVAYIIVGSTEFPGASSFECLLAVHPTSVF